MTIFVRTRQLGMGMLCAAAILIVGKLLRGFRLGASQRVHEGSGDDASFGASRQRQGFRATVNTFDPECYEAFARMMAQPDAADLPRRASVCRFEGEPGRRATRLPGILMGWLQRRHLDIDAEEPLTSATRAPWTNRAPRLNPGLRVLRPAAVA